MKVEGQKKHTRHGNETFQAHRVDLWRIGAAWVWRNPRMEVNRVDQGQYQDRGFRVKSSVTSQLLLPTTLLTLNLYHGPRICYLSCQRSLVDGPRCCLQFQTSRQVQKNHNSWGPSSPPPDLCSEQTILHHSTLSNQYIHPTTFNPSQCQGRRDP